MMGDIHKDKEMTWVMVHEISISYTEAKRKCGMNPDVNMFPNVIV